MAGVLECHWLECPGVLSLTLVRFRLCSHWPLSCLLVTLVMMLPLPLQQAGCCPAHLWGL